MPTLNINLCRLSVVTREKKNFSNKKKSLKEYLSLIEIFYSQFSVSENKRLSGRDFINNGQTDNIKKNKKTLSFFGTKNGSQEVTDPYSCHKAVPRKFLTYLSKLFLSFSSTLIALDIFS